MSFTFRKYTALLLVCSIFANIFSLTKVEHAYAAPDPDGSANVDLYVTPSVPSSSLIGTNFTYTINLENKNTSDGDGYRPGFVLSLPAGINLVGAGTLGTPVRTVIHNSGSTLYFFETNQIALKGTTVQYPITLASTNAAGVFVTKNIGVLAYIDDSIYGRGSAPSGSPPATRTGGIDFAAGSGVSMPDTTDLTFPDNITSSSNLNVLPFVTPQTQFVPFDVRKSEEPKELIGIPFTTTLHVIGNSMGPLRHFHLQDVIPNNRGFSGVVSVVGGTIGGTNITYDAPTGGAVTLDFTDIFVPTSSELLITYETVPLAYSAQSYSGGIPVLNTGAVIPHKDPSPNTVTMHTGGLALVGGPYPQSTWNDGTSDILVNSQSIVPPRTMMVNNRYANLSISSNIASAVIGDLVTYTLELKTAKNAAFTTNGSGSYIEDILPDGLTFSGTLSSLITDGTGTPLSFVSSSTNVDGDTTVIWRLNSGVIGANSTAKVVYQAVLDAAFEGAGDTEYENTETLINDASFFGTVGDGSLSGIWGMTDPSIVDTSIYIDATNLDNATATVSAPIPSMKKQLISITLPNGSVYDYNTGFPSYIAPGSALRFALTMDFPRVNFINPKIIDALPLLAGPNESAYDIAFQTNPTLKDIYNTGVLFNTNDGVTPASDFNGLNLIGSIIPNAAWISTTPANNLEFQLNSGVGRKTFAILFTVDILATEPAGGISTSGLVPLTNYAYSTYNDDSGAPLLLPVMDIPFTVNFPSVNVVKTVSGSTNIEAGKDIDYSVVLTNTGAVPAYLENIVDTLPANMDFITGSVMASGALSPLPFTSMIQSGNTLLIAFDTGATMVNRSTIPIDDSGTPTIRENIVKISYTLRPNTNFVIAGGATRTNTISLDYYASTGALSNDVNNLGPKSASANVTVKSPTLVRSLLSTSESDSSTNNLYVGEEVVYRTIINVPNGTFTLANYSETINANLQFLSGSVIASSGSLTFSSGTTFSGATVRFGTLTNADTDTSTTETITIDTTYRVLKNATAGTNYNNNGTFTYSSTSTASSIAVNVRKPTITLTKLVSPATADAGDTVTYTITANNTSTTADAYDIRITDVLPGYLTYVTGSLVLGTFSGSDLNLFTSSGGGNGLTLDRIGVSSGASFSLQAILNTTVQPANSYTNRADLIYDTLDDDGSLYEWSGGTSATAVVSVPDITLSHSITSTSLVDTTSTLFSGSIVDVAIGERVFYTTTLGFPEGFATGVSLTQTLPSSMKFLSGYILFDGVTSHTLSTISISPDNIITFSLGDVDNTGIGAGTGITIVTEAVMLDNPANTAGSIKTSTMLANYSEKSKSVNTFVEVVEPSLSVVKDYSPNTGDGGDTIPVSITVTNTSSVHAYDVVLTDISPSKLTPGIGFSGTINIGTLAPGQSVNYAYDSTIHVSVNPGEILTGTASVVYTTYPGTPTEGERSYTAFDNDFINIITPGSIALDLLTASDVSIGNISQYEIRIPVGEGLTNILSVSSLLPAGMAIIPSSVVITPDASITYSGSVVPVATPDSDTILAASTQTVVYTFTGVNNSNVDNGTTEYITIRYDAITLNSTDNNNGNTKNHTVTVLYDGSNTKSGSSLPIVIREPNVILNVSNTYAYNTSVPYVFTLTNTGTATAYNLDLSTLIPPGVSYTGNISITNSGGAVNLNRVGDTFTLDSLPVNGGNPLIFTINGAISESVPNFTNLTLTGTVIYTSEAGVHLPSTSNVLETERTSGGGVNDYIDANKTTAFILNIPLLDEAISVIDVNGGDGIIGDIFEYTISLTNTGNVALTAIPVTLDIPSGFTGFLMVSTPPGSTDLSTSTGGTNGAGYLSLSGINIAIGATVTIVYRIQALTSVEPGTSISTTAIVGNSFEGAIGGSPSVPVVINAPKFISSAIETDINGGNMLRNERIQHVLTLTNTGTATGTNISVTIPWSHSGSSYVADSLLFQSGTMSDTGTVFEDAILGRITFTIPALPPGALEIFRFQTLTTGPIGATITTNFSADSEQGVGTTAVSNILAIVDDTPGGGGASIGGNKPPSTILPSIVVQTPKVKPLTSNTKTKKAPKKTPVVQKNPIDAEYEKYLALKKRLAAIIELENTAGTKNFVSPKILPQTGKSILDRVKKLVNAKLSLDVPKFEKGDESLDSYLKNLPLEDQYRDEYVVLPSNGMITPVNTLEKELPDYKKLISGREIDVNKYLKTGVMTYPGTNVNGYGGVGNPVIFGHSSYYKNDSGRYKTHFQKIIELEQSEEVWIYKKQGDGSYKRYRYAVTESYEIKPSNVKILDPGIGKNLTLFTCTPIGGISGRWLIQAKYIDEEKIQIETSLYGTNLMPKEKKSIQAYFQGIDKLSKDEKKSRLLEKFTLVAGAENTDMNRYFRMQIAKKYSEL